MVVVAICLAVAAGTWVYRAAAAAGTGLPAEPGEVVRHAVITAALALAVVVQGGALRATRHPGGAAALPAVVAVLPAVVDGVSLIREWLTVSVGLQALDDLAAPDPITVVELSRIGWLVAVHPGWVAVLALLGTDGLRSTWRRGPALVASAVVVAGAALAWWRPEAMTALRGTELGPLRAVLAGMVLCAAAVGACRLPAATRWATTVGLTVPSAALAILPTLVTAPAELSAGQRWTVVAYPLTVLAAATPAVLLMASSDLVHRRRGQAGRSPADGAGDSNDRTGGPYGAEPGVSNGLQRDFELSHDNDT